jgi:lysophospholipase L1-like esterase
MRRRIAGTLRPFAVKLLILAAALVLASLMLEGFVLLIFGEQAKFPRRVVGSQFGLRVNQPRATYRHKSADVNIEFRINGQGMRADRDYAYHKPSGLSRVVSLGDSFTIGYEVRIESCFSSILERELNARGYRTEVLNAGVSGYGTAEEYLYLKRELLKYEPDVVLVAFYSNDIADNVRTNLFRLERDRLVEVNDTYVPAGRLGDFLNTNWFFNFLSERSNAFVLLKEQLTDALKRGAVADHIESLNRAERSSTQLGSAPADARALTAALYERIYQTTRERGIPLIILSIPTYRRDPDRLIDAFPRDLFSVNRMGIHFLSGKELLALHLGKVQLYWLRSHLHWTPFAHEIVGRAIADLVMREGLLAPDLPTQSQSRSRH